MKPSPPLSAWQRLHARLSLSTLLAERSLALALVLAVIAGVTQWIVWLQRDLGETDRFVGPPRSDYTLDRFTLTTFNENGKLAVTVQAPRLAKHPQLDSFEIDAPQLRMRDANGVDWNATSKAGWVSGDGKELRLVGAVEVDKPATARQGAVSLRTEALTAFTESSLLKSDTAVTVTQPGSILRGTGLDADLKRKRFTLRNEVRARFEPKGNAAPATR